MQLTTVEGQLLGKQLEVGLIVETITERQSTFPTLAVIKVKHTSKPWRRPRFIISLQRFGTRHINSTAFC